MREKRKRQEKGIDTGKGGSPFLQRGRVGCTPAEIVLLLLGRGCCHPYGGGCGEKYPNKDAF